MPRRTHAPRTVERLDDSPPTDRLLTLREAGASLPKPRSAQALWRWATHGIRGVRLRTCVFGREHFTTEADLRAFGRQLASVASTPSARR